MENEIDLQDEIKLRLTPLAENYLLITTRWVKFLAILGFVMAGILVVMSFAMGAIMSLISNAGAGSTGQLPAVAMSAIMLIGAAIYFIIAFYMYRFATKTQRGIKMREEYNLEEGFKALKTYYLIAGVMVVVVLSIYALILFIAIIAGLASAF